MSRRQRSKRSTVIEEPAIPAGGRLKPLDRAEVAQIVDTAIAILSDIGMAGVPAFLCQQFCDRGASVRADGRVCFPRSMVEQALSRAPSSVNLPGFEENRGLTVGGGRVHIGTGGAAIKILDSSTMRFRDSNLADLHLLMRMVDTLPNIRYGVRPTIARDIQDLLALDINTAFACLRATSKPIGMNFSSADSVDQVVDLFDIAVGPLSSFREKPFCMGVVVHVVPPLSYATESIAVLEACLRRGVIPQLCSAGQAGATSPVTLAGALAQGLAESLAGLLLVDNFKPGAACIYAFMPFVSDLRTGAMSGGSGECAIANAAAAQLLHALSLPSTVSAGMTDSKRADAQAGYEKGYSVTLAAHAGADMINLSVGMLGSIMAASPEAMVIDNDMCGAILRSVQGIEVSDDALNLEMVERVVTGDGHYLGEPETLARMKSDYVYPVLGDRQSIDDWCDAGEPAIWDAAVKQVRQIANTTPSHLSSSVESRIRQSFSIHLPS